MTNSTQSSTYTQRLSSLQYVWWKRFLHVQAPYAWNLRRLNLGFVLDLGCGVGRNLQNLRGFGIGVDHNPTSVAEARSRGFEAYTVEEFPAALDTSSRKFDTLLLAHVLEHLTPEEHVQIISQYLCYIKPEGKVVLITPQEAGFESDPTHQVFVDTHRMMQIGEACNLTELKSFSFPFPRFIGRYFKYNEFVSVFEIGRTEYAKFPQTSRHRGVRQANKA